MNDAMSLLDPELRSLAAPVLEGLSALPPLGPDSLATWRMELRDPPEHLPHVPVEDREILSQPDGAPIVVHVINARPGSNRPGVLQIHGGGFVMSSARPQIRGLQELAAELDAAVVSVEYRLAPETTYAGSLADNLSALQWMHDHAAELGVDRGRIAVMGSSAGGGHAAMLAIAARDRGGPPIAFQMLVYPMLDDRTGSSRTVAPPLGELVWTAQANAFGWRCLLGQEPGGPVAPAGAVPAREADLSGLPPAYISVGGLDLFLEEDIDFARRLALAGVPVELHVVPGCFHGFDGLCPTAPVSQAFTVGIRNALARALA
jgi:acetyl esterase/lipase